MVGLPRLLVAVALVPGARAYPGTCATARARGLTCADENVTTADGYVLQVHRVAMAGGRFDGGDGGSTGPPRVALLQHGLVDSGETWVANYGNESLAYQLASRGWVVYLANSRGRPPFWHATLSPDDDAFWAFSWDEMAVLDLPATVDHALRATGAASLSYAGHSQGTTLAMVGMGEVPALAAKIDVAALLAPVGILRHGGLANFTALWRASRWLCDELPETCDMSLWDAIHHAAPVLCNAVTYPGCVDLLCDFAGCQSHGGYNRSVLVDVVFAGSYFAGTSYRNLEHYDQMERINETALRKFDFGNATANVAAYGTPSPPAYDLSKFRGRAAAFVGTADRMVHEEDALATLGMLTNADFVRPHALVDGYGHGDFIWAVDAGADLYPAVVAVLEGG